MHDIGVSDQVKLPLMDDVLLGLILLNDRVEVKTLDFLTVFAGKRGFPQVIVWVCLGGGNILAHKIKIFLVAVQTVALHHIGGTFRRIMGTVRVGTEGAGSAAVAVVVENKTFQMIEFIAEVFVGEKTIEIA